MRPDLAVTLKCLDTQDEGCEILAHLVVEFTSDVTALLFLGSDEALEYLFAGLLAPYPLGHLRLERQIHQSQLAGAGCYPLFQDITRLLERDFGVLEGGDVGERHNHATNLVGEGAVRLNVYVPPPILCRLMNYPIHLRKRLKRLGDEQVYVVIAKMSVEIGDLAPNIRVNQRKDRSGLGIEAGNPPVEVKKNDRNPDTGEDVDEIGVRPIKFSDLLVKLGIDDLKFLIDNLELLIDNPEFPIDGLKLLVYRVQFGIDGRRTTVVTVARLRNATGDLLIRQAMRQQNFGHRCHVSISI